MNRKLFQPLLAATVLLAGCAAEPSARYTFQSPDLPPSRYSGDIVYPAMPQSAGDNPSQARMAETSPTRPDESLPSPVMTAIKPVYSQSEAEPPEAAVKTPPGNPSKSQKSLPRSDEAATIVSIQQARVLNGRVTVVNEEAGVCVVNFPIGQLPPLNMILKVYRHGIRTGEIKITGPTRDDNIAAEILSGEIRTDDEARDY